MAFNKKRLGVVLTLTAIALFVFGPCHSTIHARETTKKTVSTETKPRIQQYESKQNPDDIDLAGRALGQKISGIEDEVAGITGGWVKYHVFWDVSWLKLGFCLFLILIVLVVDRSVHAIIFVRFRTLTEHRRRLEWTGMLLEALSKPLTLFIWGYGLYLALSPLYPHFAASDGSNLIRLMLRKVADFSGIVAVVWFAYRMVTVVDIYVKRWTESSDYKIDDMLAGLVGKILRVLVVLLGGLLLVQNLTGIEIGPLLASLGLGGLAIALAAKDTVANFFGTVTILLDHPFELGDVITFEGQTGTVELVGFRSTQLRTYEGHQVTIPNNKITNANVTNISRRPFMRW